MKAEDRALVDAAALVADGAPVDWVAAESRADAANRRLVRHLRLVESIATLHRTVAAEAVAEEGQLQGQLSEVQPRSPEPTGPRWGHLVLLERIGEGTSCEVYRAWDSTLHLEVALKLLNDDGSSAETQARLLDEARRLARVRHPHVVQVYGADQHNGRVGLWMELIRGESLDQIVRTRGAFGAREAALIGLDLCAALAAVHRAGLLHRDVKAQNVMRESGGRIVLMDFGTGEELSGTNRLVGTPLYLAPEIFRGQRASVQSDIYSLGVLLYYMVCGQFPVAASSMEQLARAHGERQRQPLRDVRPDVPEAFVGVTERALDGDPARRHKSVGEIESSLRESLSAPQPSATATAAPAPVLKPRFGFGVLAAVAALVVTVVGLIVWTRSTESNRGATLSTVRTIAVMPMSEGGATNLPLHFSTGLVDELIGTLGQIPGLNVKSGRAVRQFQELSPQELAAKLDVDALLETVISLGTASPSDPERIRLRVNLIAAGTQNIVWTQTFDRPRGESLALQGDIASAFARAVDLPLTPEAITRFRGQHSNPAAEDAYLLGRFHLNQYGGGSAEQALSAFGRALQLDPKHAGAHAGSAWAHATLGIMGVISHAQARALSLAEVNRALEFDAELAEARTTLGYIYFVYDWNWPAAEQEYKRSVELNPSSPYARSLYGEFLAAMGRFDEALAQTETAKRMDPESGPAARRTALVKYYGHDFNGAEAALRDAAAIEPNAAGVALLEGRIAEARGRFAEALDATRRAGELSGGGGVPLQVQLIRQQALAGEREAAMSSFRTLQSDAAAQELRLSQRDLAYIQFAFGNTDAAFASLKRSIEDRDPTAVWIGVDPRFDAVKNDPRFRAVLAQIGLPGRP